MKKAMMAFLLGFALAPLMAQAHSRCEGLFSSAASAALNTPVIDKFIQDLASLRFHLDQSLASGKSNATTRALILDFQRKEDQLIRHLESQGLLNRDQVRTKMKTFISELQKETLQKNEKEERKKEESRQILHDEEHRGEKAVFHPIKAGTFLMKSGPAETLVKLTQDFEMMAYPTTQVLWQKVAELANSQLEGHYALKTEPSELKGDLHPVENVSWGVVQTWLKALNELSDRGEPALQEIFPDHRQGDHYTLPTSAQWYYVTSQAGTYQGMQHPGAPQVKITDIAWVATNARGKTQPVGQLDPIEVQGQKFYDLFGNVAQWMQNNFSALRPDVPLVDPQGPLQGDLKAVRGGGFLGWEGTSRLSYEDGAHPYIAQNWIGFRMIRVRK